MHPHVALLFPFLAILVGVVCVHFASRVKCASVIPYTATLFLCGILVGICHVAGWLGHYSDSIGMWVKMDPHLLLYAFLPALLFGDSMSINWHDFQRCAPQCCILAGPGVLIGTLSLFCVARYLFPYGWDVNRCAAFSSILAATDPVAVVALLKEMGASRALTMQIAGESLLNDGAAIVVWLVFYNMLDGEEYTALELTKQFVQLGMGGLLFGVAAGLLTLHWISWAGDSFVHSDHLVQLALTVTAAYLVFFFGEQELKVSGVLATIFCALILGKAAWPLFCCSEAVQHVWHALEFFGNTILFLLCGLVFYTSLQNIEAQDWFWLFVLYILATLARGVMIVGLLPLMNRVTKAKKTTWKEALVMTWGGLRGAVGLALALSTRERLIQLNDQRTGDLMVFFVGGVAGLTLLVNATTCGPLLKYLELTRPPQARQRLLESLGERLVKLGAKQYAYLHSVDKRFAAVTENDLRGCLLHLKDNSKLSHVTHMRKSLVVVPSAENGWQEAPPRAPSDDSRQDDAMNLSAEDIDDEVPTLVVPVSPAPKSGAAGTAPSAGQTLVKGLSGSDMGLLALPGSSLSKSFNESEGGVVQFPSELPGQWFFGSEQPPERALDSMACFPPCPEEVARAHWWWGFEPVAPMTAQALAGSPSATSAASAKLASLDPKELEVERELFLSMLRAEYMHQLKMGMLPEHALGANHLFSSIDAASDFFSTGLADWEVLLSLMCGKRQGCLDWLVATSYRAYCPICLENGDNFDLFTLVVFLDAHHLVAHRMIQGDLGKPSEARLQVMLESAEELEMAHQFLKDSLISVLQISAVRTKQMAIAVLMHQREKVEEWLSTGVVTAGEVEELIGPVHHAMKHVAEVAVMATGESRLSQMAACISDSRSRFGDMVESIQSFGSFGSARGAPSEVTPYIEDAPDAKDD